MTKPRRRSLGRSEENHGAETESIIPTDTTIIADLAAERDIGRTKRMMLEIHDQLILERTK
jgi:hypothetical protein